MKRTALFLSLIFLITGNTLFSQSLDEVLNKHFSAVGQENVLKVNSQKITGKMIQGGLEIPFIQMAKRPAKVRVEASFQGLTLIQTFNGTEGWTINPFAGVTEPQPMSADEVKSMLYQADMDGMLWNWKEKGYTITLEGTEDMEGTSCYKIKIVTKSGDTFTVYIDSDSYVILRQNTKVLVMGNESENDSYYSNYSVIDGMAYPGKVETKINGQLAMTMTFDKVEINLSLDDTLFEKPSK